MNEWQPIETAPKRGEIVVRSADGETEKAIWFFGDWGTTEPILGDRLEFTPTHWMAVGDRESDATGNEVT